MPFTLVLLVFMVTLNLMVITPTLLLPVSWEKRERRLPCLSVSLLSSVLVVLLILFVMFTVLLFVSTLMKVSLILLVTMFPPSLFMMLSSSPISSTLVSLNLILRLLKLVLLTKLPMISLPSSLKPCILFFGLFLVVVSLDLFVKLRVSVFTLSV